MKGWIKLDRQILEHEMWQEKPFSKGQAWVDMLLLANHKDNKILIDDSYVVIKRGSFHTSIQKLSARWGWDRKKVMRFLDVLEKDMMLSQKRTSKGTTLNLVNYCKFQDSWDSDKDKGKDNQWDTNKKYKKDKNKNIYKLTQFTQGQKREYSHEFFEELEGSEL